MVNGQRSNLYVHTCMQGIRWVKEREGSELLVIRLGQGNVLTAMQDALEAGRCVLIENMGESIDAALMPIIARATFRKGRATYVRLGGKDVQWHPGFRLILHTKLTNPHYPPDVQVHHQDA